MANEASEPSRVLFRELWSTAELSLEQGALVARAGKEEQLRIPVSSLQAFLFDETWSDWLEQEGGAELAIAWQEEGRVRSARFSVPRCPAVDRLVEELRGRAPSAAAATAARRRELGLLTARERALLLMKLALAALVLLVVLGTLTTLVSS